jgi:sigma-B regulation protein RsbU (phosphoserine phosphatase)
VSFVLPRPTGDEFDANAVPLDENSLQTAMRGIVESLYGPPVRRLPGLDIGRAYRGAEGEFRFGGDVVDVFHYGAGYTSLSVVDITGHGMPAARNAGLAKHALRAYASNHLDAADCVRALNRLCIENSTFEGDVEFFATLFFAIVQPDRRTMEYVSAGHDAAYLLSGGETDVLGATGPIIGLMDDDAAFERRLVRLSPGSIVAAVTDGFSEARDGRRTFLGAEALADVIRRNQFRDAERQAEAVTQYAYDFAGGQLHDDVAALVVKVATPP